MIVSSAPPRIPEGPFPFEPRLAGPPPASAAALDTAVADLVARRAAWVGVPVSERIAILDELRRSVTAVADEWTDVSLAAEGLDPADPTAYEEAVVGPYLMLRNLRLLRDALVGIERTGRPRIPGPVWTRPDGTVVARVVPGDPLDRLLFLGVTADVWMAPGVTKDGLAGEMARAYREPDDGGVCLVLGAGNVTSIAPMDVLYKLFVENRVVILKTHPVLGHLGPAMEAALAPLVDRCFVRVLHGAAAEGAHLVGHPDVDQLHITGSVRTYENIVFGPGEAGQERRRRDEPILHKPFTAELGNVTPIIIVPGRWSSSDIAYHADNVSSMLTNNAGFNCTAARVVVTHASWPQRAEFLDALRARFAGAAPRLAYYPGAAERWDAYRGAHPEAEAYGERSDGHLPWMLVTGLDPAAADEPCYTTEAFCSLTGETAIEAPDAATFVDRAVEFSNERLWGTLTATLIASPAAWRDPEVGEALHRAERDLRYGTISFNHWSAAGYALAAPPWGAYPGHVRTDIGSGVGFVHNTLMFDRPQKTVMRAPFRAIPKPFWFTGHRRAHEVARRLVSLEAKRSVLELPGLFLDAFRG